ncbi:MAG: hypothetical protein MZV63_29850 [Marinilabiliales bacterium]|nr:hypothetical protein [Marinilabiliales bacterium]
MEKRSKMMGLWNASIPLGTAIGVTMGGIIASTAGDGSMPLALWRCPGLIIAVLFLFVKDYKTVDLSRVDNSDNVKVKMERKGYDQGISEEAFRDLSPISDDGALIFVTTAMIVWLPKFFDDYQRHGS